MLSWHDELGFATALLIKKYLVAVDSDCLWNIVYWNYCCNHGDFCGIFVTIDGLVMLTVDLFRDESSLTPVGPSF